MKKRWIAIIAIFTMLITLASCTTANRAARRTHVTPAPTTAPRAHRAPAAKPAVPKTQMPRHHVTPRATQPMPAPSAQPFAGRDGFRSHEGFRGHDGFRHGADGRNTFRSGLNRDGYRDGINDSGSTFRGGLSRDGGRDTFNDNANSGTHRIAPRKASPKFRAAPPVRSIPRANRLPATRMPLR